MLLYSSSVFYVQYRTTLSKHCVYVVTDWLLDRRHCDVKWQAAVLEIREKINAAIQDMPPVDEISQLLTGTCELI